MSDGQTSVTLEDVLEAAVNQQLNRLRVGLPGIVITYDSVTQIASVRPALTDLGGELLPIITQVPVIFPRSGGFAITWPLLPGDEVWILFGERSIDRFVALGGYQQPDNPRRFDWTDAVAIPGISPKTSPIETASGSAMVLGTRQGTSQIEITPALIRLGAQANDFVALAQLVLNELGNIVNAFNTHVHTGVTTGAGTSGMPAQPMGSPSSVAATKVKAE